MSKKKFDIVIVGAGIIGLATAYKMLESEPALSICILEKENGVAEHQSGHNSGVIHSGIYYKPGSLKAVNCKRGYKMMLDFCDEHNVKYELCGKLIVATEQNELEPLQNLYKRGLENGLSKISILDAKGIKQAEPDISGIKAIDVPYTGITDFKLVSQRIYELLLHGNAEINFNSKVTSIEEREDGYTLKTKDSEYYSDFIVNCAGLFSDVIAQYSMPNLDIRVVPFRGEFFKVERGDFKINSHIYPVPDPTLPFLGVHLTKTIYGGIKAGPNAVPALKREGYKKLDFNLRDVIGTFTYPGALKLFFKYRTTGMKEIYRSISKKAFVKSLRKFSPGMEQSDLVPYPAGVRAQAVDTKGNIIDDFLIYERGNIFNICNAPSPAATSSFSIGKTISDKIMNNINR